MTKQVDNPQHISLLIPTRARTAYLQRLFASLEATTSSKNEVDAWVYVDEDDDATRGFIAAHPTLPYTFQVHWLVGERTNTQGEMTNRLWERSASNAGIYFPLPDDYVFTTPGWDRLVRDAFNRFPDRIVLVYPDEATASVEQVTLIILSAEWLNATQHFMTAYFPFWFDDTWVDQVAQMIQRKVKVGVHADPQGNKGKTIRMRNLRFWNEFFRNTLDERVDEAERLRRAIYPPGSAAYQQNAALGAAVAQRIRAQSKPPDIEAVIYTERTFGGEAVKLKPNAKYLAVEANAAQHLYHKAVAAINQQRYGEALDLLENIRYASQTFTQVEYARAVCLSATGHGPEARQAALAERERQPGHPGAAALLAQLDARDAGVISVPGTIHVDDGALVPTGDNMGYPRLNLWSELRVRLMPLTLRLQTVGGLMASKPVQQWPADFLDLWTRFWRRRAN